jgi:tryptophan synthase alpha chain
MSNENLPQGANAAAAASSGAVGNDGMKFDGKAAIASAFANGKAFIPFVTCGDPDLATTEELVCAMADAGASLIELGIPFSDPTAEGPVIQEANLRALSGGVTTDDVFDLVSRLRNRTQVPLAIMTYANVVYSYGIERFCGRMAEVGVAGLILPDVPFEEKEEFAGPCRDAGVVLVSMVAPTSAGRVRMIAEGAEGFLYCVSSLGVTGMRSSISGDVAGLVQLVREVNPDIPCAIGFGISTPEQAANMAAVSDGAIVGSAVVRLVAEHGKDSVQPVRAFVEKMAKAAKEA